MKLPSLLLASASPRRAELLRSIGYEFDTQPVAIVEIPLRSESAIAYGQRVALEKAQTALALQTADQVVVLSADTEVSLGKRIYGKPADADAACEMLASLSGRRHRVISAVAILSQHSALCFHTQTMVEFRPISDGEIADYVATGEAYGKAGAYAIQGRAACFVRRLQGSYSNVVGLPVYETAAALAQLGLTPSWRRCASIDTQRANGTEAAEHP